MPPRLSARERNELEKQDALLMARPFKAGPQMLGAHTRHMVRLLRNRRSASPSTDAVGFMAGVFERSVAGLTPAPEKARIACRTGCAYCCAQPVAVTPMEVFALSALVRARKQTAAAVTATAEKVRDRSLEGSWVRCPLLEENSCSVYALRPLSCHSYVSFNVQDCIKAFVMQDKPSVYCPQSYIDMMNACRMVMVAALKVCGMPSVLYELNTALAVALAVEDGETRWRQGENIFANLAPTPVDLVLDEKIARFAEDVASTL
jgi:Fe-S-cluster containining protein